MRCSEREYAECLQEHIFAEIQAEVKDGAESAEHRISLKTRLTQQQDEKVVLEIESYALDFDPHLLVVKVAPSGKIGILKRAGGVFEVEFSGGSYLRTVKDVSFEVIAGLSEYAKQIYALSSEDLLPYLVNGKGPPPLNFTGWEAIASAHRLDDSQAQAVQRYLNTERGVMLLEGPPGTGKSHTIAVLVKKLIATSDSRIVVTAPSNKALESIARKLEGADYNFRIVACEEKMPRDLHYRLVKMCDVAESNARVLLCTMSRCCKLSTAISDVELIIDEAGQATQPLSFIPFMLRPRRCLMVGDIQQLQPLVRHAHAREHNFAMSMMERLQRLSEEEGIPVPRLIGGYRCAGAIMAFSNRMFYGNALTTQCERNLLVQEGIALPQMCMIDVPYRSQSSNCVSAAEIFAICQILRWFNTRPGINISKDVVVLCFYKDQLLALEQQFRMRKFTVPVATVDSFQGSEKKIVLVSFSRTQGGPGFLKEANRLNVALTRAQHSLVLLGDYTFLTRVGRKNILGHLMQYVEDCHVRRSLQNFFVRSEVEVILQGVDSKALPNYFLPLSLPFEQALIMKKIEAESMSFTVHSDLVRLACSVIGDVSDVARKIVEHYTARKYASISDVEDDSDLHIFCALRDFHALEFSRSQYEEKLAEFENLSGSIGSVYLRQLAKSTALWIRFRLCAKAAYDDIIQGYEALDEEYLQENVQGTQHLLKRGTVLLRMGRHQEAIAVLKRVADIEDHSVHALNFDDVYAARCMIAEALHGNNAKSERVRSYLRRAISLSDLYSMQRAWAYELLAGSFMDADNIQEAYNQSTAAMMRNPGNAHAYLIYCDSKARLQKLASDTFICTSHYSCSQPYSPIFNVLMQKKGLAFCGGRNA